MSGCVDRGPTLSTQSGCRRNQSRKVKAAVGCVLSPVPARWRLEVGQRVAGQIAQRGTTLTVANGTSALVVVETVLQTAVEAEQEQVP